jgi:hypothetical protein
MNLLTSNILSGENYKPFVIRINSGPLYYMAVRYLVFVFFRDAGRHVAEFSEN